MSDDGTYLKGTFSSSEMVMLFSLLIGQVICGNHKADSCDKCPQGHGESWCNGDCKWTSKGQCINKNGKQSLIVEEFFCVVG